MDQNKLFKLGVRIRADIVFPEDSRFNDTKMALKAWIRVDNP